MEQEAKGRLERQKISDEAEAEKSRKELLELQANSAAVESTGQAKAEAQSRAEASRIEGEAAVEQAKLKVCRSLFLLCKENMISHSESYVSQVYIMVLHCIEPLTIMLLSSKYEKLCQKGCKTVYLSIVRM